MGNNSNKTLITSLVRSHNPPTHLMTEVLWEIHMVAREDRVLSQGQMHKAGQRARGQGVPASAWPLNPHPSHSHWAVPVLTIPHEGPTCRTHTVPSGKASVTIRPMDLQLDLVKYTKTRGAKDPTDQRSSPVQLPLTLVRHESSTSSLLL